MARGGNQVIPRRDSWRVGAPNPWLERRDDAWRYDPERIAVVLSRLTDLDVVHEMPTTPMRPPFVHATRQSGVLLPLFVGADGDTRLVLTRRDSQMRNHRGEVAFPGGRVDIGETPHQAAIREAHEEVGLPPERVRVIGQLEPLTTVISAAAITPVVGFIDGPLPTLVPSPDEVDRIFDVSLRELTDPDCYREEIWDFPDGTFPVWFFEVEDDTIWGATGRMIRRLLDLTLLSDP
jgi:8-oxo-dGTP pyrophosphatase MutT (NUDIX family)